MTKLGRMLIRTAAVLAVAGWGAQTGWAQELKARADRADGVYAAGQTVVFRVEIANAPAGDATAASYVLRKGQFTDIGRGTLTLAGGSGTVTSSLPEPGTILFEAKAKSKGRELKALAGAVFAPEKIAPSAPPPDDFDAFWAAKIKELSAAPMNPVLEPGDSGKKDVEYAKITLDGFRGTKIHGQLARPKNGKPKAALLIVQWAGVYPLEKGWVTGPAAEGFLALNLEAHDLPIDAPASFYEEQKNGPLKDYPAIGNDSRETSYFLRMYLSAYRAADYLMQCKDWNGKDLAVTGGSQGGLQTLMLAGLHPKITAAMADVPAGCDHTGAAAGRAPGWPQWNSKTDGKDKAKVLEASRYYDVVNFAAHIRCPALVGTGLIDQTCPAAGVLAACNAIPGPHEVVIMPLSAHQAVGNTQAAFYARQSAWHQAILAGRPLPPAKP